MVLNECCSSSLVQGLLRVLEIDIFLLFLIEMVCILKKLGTHPFYSSFQRNHSDMSESAEQINGRNQPNKL